MKRSIIGLLSWLLVSLAVVVTGCATSSTTKKSAITNQAVVRGTPKAAVENVIQWCQVYRLSIMNHGENFLLAQIREYRLLDGDFVFENNCGVSPFGSPMQTLDDPRVRVSAEVHPDDASLSIVTVQLDGRSQIGNCTSSGVVEHSIFRYLGATPMVEEE